MPRKSMLSFAFIFGLALIAPRAEAQCPVGQFYVDLKTCFTSPMPPFVTVIGACKAAAVSAACPAAAQWKEIALKIVIPPTCTQANVVVEWEGLPAGFTVNLGDSPTNDAFAGDAGSTPNQAEMWIQNEIMSVANNGTATSIDNPLLRQDLSLTDAAMKFVVKNQFLSWGQPYGILQTPASKRLFAIPDPTVAAADQRALYLGLNRVIVDRADRKGCGARRALVTFK